MLMYTRSLFRYHRIILQLALFCVLVSLSVAQISYATPAVKEFKRYERKPRAMKLLTIKVSGDTLSALVFDSLGKKTQTEVSIRIDELLTGESDISFGSDFIKISGHTTPFSRIAKITDTIYPHGRIAGRDIVEITFWGKLSTFGVSLRQSADSLALTDNVVIDADSFLRGTVINFGGDIIVDGEVNRSAISFGGLVRIKSTGIVRRSAISIGGEIKVDEGAKIYGVVYPNVNIDRRSRRRMQRWYTSRHNLNFRISFAYNRVDGALPQIGWKFSDTDSLLPEIKLMFGIATNSERDRVRLDFTHSIPGSLAPRFYATFYKALMSDDKYLLSESQNSVFALLATEGYKNFYEASGGEIGIRLGAKSSFQFSVGAYTERVVSLNANPELWSLFGGSKKFPANYQGLSVSENAALALEANRSKMSGVKFGFSFYSKNKKFDPETELRLDAMMEVSIPSWKSDFDFNRFTLEAGVKKRLGKRFGAEARTRLTSSGGDLPRFRQFCLGGYRWQRGFEHKEFSGSNSWAAAFDFYSRLSHLGFGFAKLWLFYDFGEISQSGTLGESEQIKSSIGAGLSIDGFLRFNLARRLDISDPNMRFSVEF